MTSPPQKRSPGRPTIGPPVKVHLPEALLSLLRERVPGSSDSGRIRLLLATVLPRLAEPPAAD